MLVKVPLKKGKHKQFGRVKILKYGGRNVSRVSPVLRTTNVAFNWHILVRILLVYGDLLAV